MGLKERSEERRKRIAGTIVHGHQEEERSKRTPRGAASRDDEAEDLDLEFWQSLTPQQRLWAQAAAVEHIHQTRGPNVDPGAIGNATFARIAKGLILRKLNE